jgi:AcrR family transcriptional regulator
VGAVYHHFRDKKALLYALLDRATEQFRATTEDAVDPARWEGASIVDILEGYLDFSLEVGRERPGFQRVSLEASIDHRELREHLTEARSELERGLAALVLARRDEIGHPDPVLATDFVLGQLGSMLRTRLNEILGGSLLDARADEEFVREALRSVCAYLQLRPVTIEAPGS